MLSGAGPSMKTATTLPGSVKVDIPYRKKSSVAFRSSSVKNSLLAATVPDVPIVTIRLISDWETVMNRDSGAVKSEGSVKGSSVKGAL